VYGVDLGSEWRARRWRRLLNLIDGLPGDSEFWQARMNDEEYAAAVLDADLPDEGPPLATWSPTVNMLAKAVDLLQQQLRQNAAAHGEKPGTFKPEPRPRTAVERLRERRKWDEYHAVMALWNALPEGDDTA
jgi:hypothetical protein